MIDDQKVIDHIVSECRKLQGEVILHRTIFESEREDFENIPPERMMMMMFDDKAAIELIDKMKAEKKRQEEFMKCMDYNNGKFDAYMDMLKFFGYDYKAKDEDDETE